MADEKTAEILKLYSDLTPNEKHLVGVFRKMRWYLVAIKMTVRAATQ